MYKGMTAPVLEPVGEGKVALQSVNVEAVIENLLCEITVRQVYRNLEKINIEAIYTFPLPLSAVLLDMTIKTKTRKLKGIVVEKTEAEDRYENAITDGDTAIMLEQSEPGLYTMNVGNLQPEDEIEISITYAELFKWQDDSLRFFLPTTIAPRYGDPESVGLQPHQTPEYDLMHDNAFKIIVTILGELSDASFKSPSHQLNIEKQKGKTIISLQKGKAFMDRDFVLNLFMESEQKSLAMLDKNFDSHVALASFYPRFPGVASKTPRCITIIVDCSGSMQGDSIAQARKALYEILDLLRPEDTFNVIRFGSSFNKLFPDPVKAVPGNLKKANNLLETLEADMGGTEIGQAVAAAIESNVPEELSKEVLLITDGEVWDWESVTLEAKISDFRFFTVGVGSAVSEAFIQTLAEATGGAYELVSPREDMAEKIVRHFKRIYFPKAGNISITWPRKPDKVFPEQIGSLYDGDTLHIFGRFKEKPVGEVTLTANLENGETFTQKLPVRETIYPKPEGDAPGTTARMAAEREIISMADSKAVAELAVKYQLMSQHTNYLAIDVKADGEKAKNLPALRKPPQMLAAGWGGTGSVKYLQHFNCEGVSMDYELSMDMDYEVTRKRIREIEVKALRKLTHPNRSRKLKHFIALDSNLDTFIEVLNMLHTKTNANKLAVSSIQDLESYSLPEEISNKLVELSKSGVAENIIVVVFLYFLSHHEQFKKTTSRQLKRVIAKTYKQLPDFDEVIVQKIEKIVCDNV